MDRTTPEERVLALAQTRWAAHERQCYACEGDAPGCADGWRLQRTAAGVLTGIQALGVHQRPAEA